MAADGDLDSSKAKSTSTQGECSREQLKTVPSSLEGFQQRWGQRWMMSLSPVQEMCWGVRRPTDAMQLMRGACTLARCFGLSSWFLFFWFMQRKGAQRHDPGRVGLDGMFVLHWRGCRVCAVRSEGLFQREPSSRANSQSPVGEHVGGGLPW